MEIEKIFLKLKEIEKIKQEIKKRKEILSSITKRNSRSVQDIKIRHHSEMNWVNYSLELTSNEVIQILTNSIDDLQKELKKKTMEINGQIIEVK